MLKHYFDHHQEEELEKMKFGAKIIKTARTAFNRQVGESVYIQENAANHEILNSKSEYNRCALPRLTTKMGDTTVDKIEKMKKEEIEKERELMKKIRDLKVHQSNRRREIVSSKIQPAAKRRKINKEEFKRVQQDERQSKKRIDEERKDVAENYFPIFKRAKKNTPEEENEKGRLETDEKEINVEERIESEEERTNKEIEDEKIKEERKRRAEKLSKGWELFKICKEIIEKEGGNWKISKERREIEKKREEEKQERILRAQIKQGEWKKTRIQMKITETLEKLPSNRAEQSWNRKGDCS